MTVPRLPAQNTDENHPHAEDPDRQRQAERPEADSAERKDCHIATEEECLAVLSRLSSLVLLGLITTAKAALIRNTYTAILQHYRQRRTTHESTGVDNDQLAEVLSRHPDLANSLEPLLSEEQVKVLMARVRSSHRGVS